jgi:uncharacterized delta-60 repeat protein
VGVAPLRYGPAQGLVTRMTRTRSPLRLLGCVLALALLPAATADARLGDLDPDFGDNGIALLGIADSGLGAAVIQPDGKIVVGGHAPDMSGQHELLVARLDTAGALDPSFGAGGIVQWPGVEDGEVFDLALEPDGSILAAGASGPVDTTPAPSLSRISPTGVRTPLNLTGVPTGSASLTAVTALPDGRIAVAGWWRSTAPNRQVLVGRLLANGAPDPSFSRDGWELLAVGSDARAWELDVDGVGRLTIAGEVTSALSGEQSAFAARFLSAGGPDLGFNGTGQLQMAYQDPFDGPSRFTGLVRRGDELLAAGRLANGNQGVLQRITTGGELTAGFGTAGAPPGAALWSGQGEAVALTSRGGAVVAGRGARLLQTAWLTANGTPDPAADGIQTHDIALGSDAFPLGAALGPGDRLAVAGTTASGTAFVARFTPNAPPAAALTTPGQLRTGEPAEITAQGSSDPEGETLRYAFDLDGNGSYEFDGGENPLALRSFATAGTYTVGVRVTDPRGGAATAQRRIAVLSGPLVPQPLLGKQGVARPVSGTVRYRLPGTRKFRPMTDLTAIPNGTEIDSRKGKVLLTVLHDASGRLDGARFYDGRFIFKQGKGAVPLTTLKLTNGTLSKCRKRKGARASVLAVAAKIPRSSGHRRLWGNGRGRFRTRGRYGAATVRGTKWLTDDRCDGTLVRVKRGKVAVKDLQRPRKQARVVKAGQELFVKKRGA